MGKAGRVKEKEVSIVELSPVAAALYIFKEESKEYGNFLKLLKHRISVRLKYLLLLLVSNTKEC